MIKEDEQPEEEEEEDDPRYSTEAPPMIGNRGRGRGERRGSRGRGGDRHSRGDETSSASYSTNNSHFLQMEINHQVQ